MDAVGRTHLHALTAADALREEFLFSQRSRRAHQLGVVGALAGQRMRAEQQRGPGAGQPEASNWRRPSASRESFGGFRRLVPRLKVTAREGQSDSQLKQKKHSAGFHSRLSPRGRRPGNRPGTGGNCRRRPGFLWSRTSGFLPTIPSSARADKYTAPEARPVEVQGDNHAEQHPDQHVSEVVRLLHGE